MFLMLREAMKSASPSRPQEMHMKRDRSGLFFCQWYGIQGIPYWCYGDRPDPSCKPCSKIELLPDVPVDDSLQKDLVEQFLFQRSGLQYMYIYCKPDARRISITFPNYHCYYLYLKTILSYGVQEDKTTYYPQARGEKEA